MGIIPCEIPLLEFDPEQTAVIGPDYEQLDLHLPRKCVFAFLGGYIDRYDQRHWGGSAYEYALTPCLDAVLAL